MGFNANSIARGNIFPRILDLGSLAHWQVVLFENKPSYLRAAQPPTALEPQDKVIVFAVYNSVIEANIIKTKLDAYGIPCFLTDENISTLYPLPANSFSGARLHIFEQDLEQVKAILAE
jgi:Putative prokaryotic signal transducing protein